MNKKEQVLDFAAKRGIIQARELEKNGISRNYLYILQKEGQLRKLGSGVYALPDMEITENVDIIEVSAQIPQAVICLISALSFHGLTTQIPHRVWVALPKDSWKPKIEHPPTDIKFFSKETYFSGIEEYFFNGFPVRIYSPAKTVADCFKFRSSVGLDVAIEALKDALKTKKTTVNELLEAAAICRVKKIIQPYIEAII